MTTQLPPCGLYRTLAPIGDIPAGRLVYFHNHGDPGPGLYLPESWRFNRARFASQGMTLPAPGDARHLEPLAAEGFYAVREPFHCCPNRCREFTPDTLVQLGYDGHGEALLFEPELIEGELGVPDRGARIDRDNLPKLRPLKVAEISPRAVGGVLH